MAKTTVVIHLPEALRDGNSALVKLAGKVDSFSLVLWRTTESQLKQQIEKEYHAMVFATRKEVRKYCPKYRHIAGEGFWTSVRTVPPDKWSLATWESHHSPSAESFVRSAASSWASPRSRSPKQRSARHARL